MAVTVASLALAAPVAAGCGSADDSAGGGGAGGKIALVAYSTPQQAYEEALIPGFQGTAEGDGVEFSTSFGGSGDQRRAVESGLPADVVAYSLEPDMAKNVEAGIVAADWNADAHEGMVTNSVVVLAVRSGNPKGIEGWNDLVRDDVEIVTPNPATSGGAKWNIMAAYGSQLEQGRSPEQALEFVKRLLANTSVQDDSARDSLQTFAGGKGDVLIGYENEALQAKEEGIELDYVIPEQTILIENPIAVTVDASDAAARFVEYARGEEGQQLFADHGYRSVLDSVAKANADTFPTPPALFTIDELGGWGKVEAEFFDPDDGAVFELQRELGNPTE